MKSAIKQSKKKVDVVRQNKITPDKFKSLINEIYDIMLNYTYKQRRYITKDSPLQVGNVLFWFQTDEDTGDAQIKFNQSVNSWNEPLIEADIMTHQHNIFFSNTP